VNNFQTICWRAQRGKLRIHRFVPQTSPWPLPLSPFRRSPFRVANPSSTRHPSVVRGERGQRRCTRIRSPPAASAPSTSASTATSSLARAAAAERATTYPRGTCKRRPPQSFRLTVRGSCVRITFVVSLYRFESALLWAFLCVVRL
jgi:hypothetical protein